jgi:signal transduction histidine kinase
MEHTLLGIVKTMTNFLLQASKKIALFARAVVTRAILCTRKVVEPRSITEDDRRKEFILNTILFISLSTLFILGLTIIWNKLHIDRYSGIDPLVFLAIFTIYGVLFYISKKGYWEISSILIVTFGAIGTLYTGWKWGASLPETLLLTVLIIEIASILINSTVGFITAGIMILGLTLLGIHEAIYLNVPDWRYDEISVTDVITYSVMFLFISFIGWLSNKELDDSLTRARKSENLLEVERNMLEQRVSDRTKELIDNQQKSLVEFEHTIRIGELARGVIHDMMNPLSSIALYIEEINNNPSKYNRYEAKKLFESTLKASRRMTDFMENTRHFISSRHTDKDISTNLTKEISIACDVVSYKARKAFVNIEIDTPVPIVLPAHPTRIHQILINILSNAIDSYDDKLDTNRTITIRANNDQNSSAIISITDNGCGMSRSHIERLFSKPETTKRGGTGIGLINVNSIIKNELKGSIEINSIQNLGTTITITLPVSAHEAGVAIDQK